MISWALLCYSGLSTQRNEKLQWLKCWEMTQTVPSPRPLPRIISHFPTLWSNYGAIASTAPNMESSGAELEVSQGGFLGLTQESTHRVVYYDKVLLHPLLWNRLKWLHFPETLGQWYSLYRLCQAQVTKPFSWQWLLRISIYSEKEDSTPRCSQLWGLSSGYRQHIIFQSTYFAIESFLYQNYI